MNEKIGKYRWTICGLVFFATTINYLDRAVISLLKAPLEKEFNWTESDYSNIVIAFQISYALGLLFMGPLVDKIGTKLGYALAIVGWSFAAGGHALVSSTLGFIVARAALGITEAGNFPAAIKTVAEWFPKKERALATGIFNSGTNVGAILAPITVPFIAQAWGWQWAFILTAATGFIWLIFWFRSYTNPAAHPRVSREELAYINSDNSDEETAAKEQQGDALPNADASGAMAQSPQAPKLSWSSLLGYRQTWAFVLGKFLTDPIWWFYLFWLPSFLKAEYGMENTGVALPVALVYIMSSIGSIYGGWLPLRLIKSGWPVFRSRKTSMFFYALAALPVMSAQWLGSLNMWLAVLIIGLAAAGHQAWSANIFTTVSDMFPKSSVGSVTGLGGMAGALGGILIAKVAGALLDHYKALGAIETGYYIMFFICASAYLVAWGIMHLLVPRMKEIKV
ncbi:MAG TPA: MFS transporter [Flavihumibacter sp.]